VLAEALDDGQRAALTRLLLLLTSAGGVLVDRHAVAEETVPLR